MSGYEADILVGETPGLPLEDFDHAAAQVLGAWNP